jgi:hypothetical protein
VRGARLHDAGKYWDAHEAWESAWRAEKDPETRRALQGLIQITAAFHKLVVMRDARSAHRILLRGIAKLARASVGLSEESATASSGPRAVLALDEFRESATRVAAIIAALDDASRFDPALVPRLVYR